MRPKTFYLLPTLLILGISCSNENTLNDHLITETRDGIISRSNEISESPLYFGRKNYNFDAIRWVHNDSMSVQIVPFEAEYIIKGKQRGESVFFDCTQLRINVFKRHSDKRTDLFVTLVSTNPNIKWENLYNPKVTNACKFTGYEIFTNAMSNRVVAVNQYENGVIINKANIYSLQNDDKENKEEIEDILYSLLLSSSCKTEFVENDPYEQFSSISIFKSGGEHDVECDDVEEGFRCIWSWIEAKQDDTDDHDQPYPDGETGGGSGVPNSYYWTYQSTDVLFTSGWYSQSPYDYFGPSIYDALSYTASYFWKNYTPQYLFEINTNSSNPITISDYTLNISKIESIISIYYNYLCLNSITQSIDNGHPVISVFNESGGYHYVLIIGYQSSGNIIYYDPKYNRIKCRSKVDFETNCIFSIISIKQL